jgi:GH15 family glucan-1,4-alpha-glucosidase
VRIGNGAFDQRQNDVFGAVLDSILLHTGAASGCRGGCGRSCRRRRRARRGCGASPTRGIWEARGAPQHYVSSKLMGWVALDRAAKLAEIGGDTS